MKKISLKNSTMQFLKFVSDNEGDTVEIIFTKGDLWASQRMISLLFGIGVPAVSKHIKNVFEDNELDQSSVVSNLETTAADGKTYDVDYYNLDMIISIGYRANSEQAKNFRRWVTGVLKEFARKGYIIDRKRMENGKFFDEAYFEHLIAEIREIRLSERRFYQKVTDIFATASDYDNKTITAQNFFATVQNKFHYAIHAHTAAELIVKRANAKKKYMGLSTWENAPDGKIVKTDVSIAKNYLKKDELAAMEHIVSAYLDLAENRALRGIPMTMHDWAKRLDIFLKADDRQILEHAGKISAEIAKNYAESEFEKYRVIQDRLFESDFDNFVKQVEKSGERRGDGQ
jgi:hypothetical protein